MIKGKARHLKLQTIPHPDGTAVDVGDKTCILKSETIARFADTGHPCFVRWQFEWPAVQSGVSKSHHHVEVTSLGGAWPGHSNTPFSKMMAPRQVWITPRKLDVPQIIGEVSHPFCVDVFHGEQITINLKERFYLPGLPVEVAAIKNEKSRMDWLAKCVRDFLKREAEQFRTLAQARQNEQDQKFPKCNPAKSYQQPDFDHHANQREVLLKLLRRKWHRLSEAMDKIKNAKTEQEKSDAQTKAWLAFIADHKAIFKRLPDINENDFAWLSKNEKWNDHYIRLMNGAIDEIPQVDKRDWQLASGWIEKNYYRMTEAELEAAFAKDWPGNAPNTGHNLATRAHRMGLVSFLTPGPKK